MEQSTLFECVATFRNKQQQKKRLIYQASPLKMAYKEGLLAFEKEFGKPASELGFELFEISVRDASASLHQWAWFEEFDLDSQRAGHVDGYALNVYTLEQLANPELIP